ncbi:MAG: glycosyltransferase [Ignavibacteriales bacterium]|nr:glycosyltransferase [Ignavibacteriales bacterium]
MRVLLLSDSDSPHTIRWAKAIQRKGITLGVFSIHKPDISLYSDCPEISLFSLYLPKDLQFKGEGTLAKLKYLKSISLLNSVIESFKPDILHAHYASSYGLLGALARFHPFIISVWGSDVYNFPNHSFLHRALIKYNLSQADKILSTSEVMKLETSKYTNKEIIVTPFGIDIDKFYPQKIKNKLNENALIIGTVKTLEKKYGIEYLIKAFKIVRSKLKSKSMKLLIVGKGSQDLYLKSLVDNLELTDDTIFTGYINHDMIQDYHNMLDISVFASIEDSESFGVSVLESSACGKPVIVSNVGGLPEVVEDGKTGFVVEKQNPEAIANVIIRLIENEHLRMEIGNNGRNKVVNEYNWIDSVIKMISIYHDFKK